MSKEEDDEIVFILKKWIEFLNEKITREKKNFFSQKPVMFLYLFM